jgi:YfiH family protein
VSIALRPVWPAPANVQAWTTLRTGGVSRDVYASLNLGAHVGDDARHVLENRARIERELGLPCSPHWLEQVHGTAVVDLERAGPVPIADAAFTRAPDRVCCVLTADCLPVLLTARDGSVVAAAHAGWRGLAAGILQDTVAAMAAPPADILAWLGPAISAANFEVGGEVRDIFLAADPDAAAAFAPNARGRWQADLYALGRRALAAAGVSDVFGAGVCTYAESDRYFSHRRAAPCGRMATLIWREA